MKEQLKGTPAEGLVQILRHLADEIEREPGRLLPGDDWVQMELSGDRITRFAIDVRLSR